MVGWTLSVRSVQYCIPLHDVPATSPTGKVYATKATGLREPFYLATNDLKSSNALADINIDKVDSRRGMTTWVIWLL